MIELITFKDETFDKKQKCFWNDFFCLFDSKKVESIMKIPMIGVERQNDTDATSLLEKDFFKIHWSKKKKEIDFDIIYWI